MTRPISLEYLAHKYLDAKELVIHQGYVEELDWQRNRCFENLTEAEFLRETAWVILSSGFRESIVRKLFPAISHAFLEWYDALAISNLMNECKSKALYVFRNESKVNAICDVITQVVEQGFTGVKGRIRQNRLDYLQEFSYIGPVTGLHLLKNIGISIAKPDRHLSRIAEATGFESAQLLCETISEIVGDGISEVDLVLWRYATLRSEYIQDFQLDPVEPYH